MRLPFILLSLVALLAGPLPAQATPASFPSATLWMSDNGFSKPQCFDLHAEVQVNGSVVATSDTALLNPVCFGTQATQYVPLAFMTPLPVTINPGDEVTFSVAARWSFIQTHGIYGRIALWYDGWNGSNSDSFVTMDLGSGAQNYHLRSSGVLDPLPAFNSAQRNELFSMVHNTWYDLGSWSLIAP